MITRYRVRRRERYYSKKETTQVVMKYTRRSKVFLKLNTAAKVVLVFFLMEMLRVKQTNKKEIDRRLSIYIKIIKEREKKR
jgi:hypothetical protein